MFFCSCGGGTSHRLILFKFVDAFPIFAVTRKALTAGFFKVFHILVVFCSCGGGTVGAVRLILSKFVDAFPIFAITRKALTAGFFKVCTYIDVLRSRLRFRPVEEESVC
jgi:hypothetical protein